MPTYAALIYGPGEPSSEEDTAQEIKEYYEFEGKARPAGVIKGGEALEPVSTATTITLVGGKGGDVVHTDGPFAETKEALGGFYLLECDDLDEALEWAAQIPAAWRGKVEVRPCMVFDEE